KSNGSEQCVESGFQISHKGRDEHLRLAPVCRVQLCRKSLFVAAADRREFRACLLKGDAFFQTSNRLHVPGAILYLNGRQAADFENPRHKDMGLTKWRTHQGRHDAHNFPGLAVQRDGLANESVLTTESRLPEFVAYDTNRRTVRKILFRCETAAAGGQDTDGL